ncbi:MAG: DUF427 domain-containing protein [Gemmatimonadales bacterium]|jgi:uncharacterized protein (DUF427 family)
MRDLPAFLRQARDGWEYRGQKRPDFAVEPRAGQESVWDYPRPPRLERDRRRVEVRSGDILVADSERAFRILETASPPTFYLPPDDVNLQYLERSARSSLCEWKGRADYWNLIAGERRIEEAAWSYATPFEGFEAVAGFFSFYPAKLECYVDGQRVQPQPGGFYGGWVTPEIVGPYKGEPGTGGW